MTAGLNMTPKCTDSPRKGRSVHVLCKGKLPTRKDKILGMKRHLCRGGKARYEKTVTNSSPLQWIGLFQGWMSLQCHALWNQLCMSEKVTVGFSGARGGEKSQ